jgi:hypothetical protein
MYDAVIVGERLSDAPLSTVPVRSGYRVLCVEQDQMPSDAPHYLHSAEVAQLRDGGCWKRW